MDVAQMIVSVTRKNLPVCKEDRLQFGRDAHCCGATQRREQLIHRLERRCAVSGMTSVFEVFNAVFNILFSMN